MKSGGVAASYLDPLAVRIESIRWGEARGWKRFLVFADLTKSRKGADYVALFAYFSFEAWLRICFAEGPRQVINALTLYAVLRADLVPTGDHRGSGKNAPIAQFFINIGILADQSHLQAVVLIGMLWTLVIWVITAINLALSVILYITFLWHHIPSADGGLGAYCRRKIDGRMERIVRVKVNKALKKDNEIRARKEAMAASEGGGSIQKQPTLPILGDFDDSKSTLARQDTQTTMATSRSDRSLESLSRQPTLPDFDLDANRPAPPSRTTTGFSDYSYRSDAPLIDEAAEMGYGAPGRSGTSQSAWERRPPPSRNMTGMSDYSERSFSSNNGFRPDSAQGGRSDSNSFRMEPLSRPGTSNSYGSRRTPGPGPSPIDGPSRRPTPAQSINPYFSPISEGGRSSPGPGRPYDPGMRSMTPQGYPPPGTRSMTPQGGPPRTYTLTRRPSDGPRLPSNSSQPYLHRIDTSSTRDGSNSYTPYTDRSATPSSAAYGLNDYGRSSTAPQSSQSQYPPHRW